MADHTYETVFVFTGPRAAFPSGVFRTRESAEEWIKGGLLSGTLTEYPVGIGVFDWAVATGNFKQKRPDQQAPSFIERFSSGAQWHEHYESGVRVGEAALG